MLLEEVEVGPLLGEREDLLVLVALVHLKLLRQRRDQRLDLEAVVDWIISGRSEPKTATALTAQSSYVT